MQNYWLKMVGAADDPLDNDWLATNPELLREVRTPRRPSGIKRGDVLVYYAAGAQKLFAIVRSTDDGEDAQEVPKAGEERWPWVLRVQARLVIPTVAQGPDWRALGIESSSIQQQSYIEISSEQYGKAWTAITERTRPQ